MFIRRKWTIHPMNAATDISLAKRWAEVLEGAEAKRLGVPLCEARKAVARDLQTAPGFLENLRRSRIKIVPSWLMARIRAAVVAQLQAEMMRLEYEIQLAKQTGLDPRDDDLAKAQIALETAKAILKGAGE